MLHGYIFIVILNKKNSSPSLCKLPSPTWRELCHFVQFLNVQLEACERSVYCEQELVEDQRMGVSGFKTFVVKFMIRMAVVCLYV